MLVSCEHIDSTTMRLAPRIDCTQTGQRCELAGTGAQCTPAHSGCAPSNFGSTCDGNTVRCCGPDGAIHELDCQHAGFAGCRTETLTRFGTSETVDGSATETAWARTPFAAR